MKTKAAVLWGLHQRWEVEEIDLDGPRHAEVMVKMTASGMCHSDEHLVTGDLQMSMQLDGTHRFHARGQDVGQMCLLGTFSEYTVAPTASVVKVDASVPLDKAALVGCGVTTGYGSTVNTGEATAGSTVVVMGVGGVGINAVQAARIVGARHIVALDPVEYKRTRAIEFGATHTAATLEEAAARIYRLRAADWDGRWHLLVCPAAGRSTRPMSGSG